VRGELDRQRGGIEDLVAHGVGERDLRRGDEVHALALAFRAALLHGEHVGLELGQLGSAHERVGIDEVGRVALGIAVLARVGIKHELREGAMQPREIPAQEREARARELGGRGKVEQPQPLADVGVVLGREVELRGRAPAAHFHVVLARLALGRARVREVGQAEEEVAQLRLHALELRLQALHLVAEPGHLGQDRGGILPLGLGGTDLLRRGIALRLQVLRTHLDVLARGFERLEARGVESEPALSQGGGYGGEVVTEQVDVEHSSILSEG